VSGNSYQSPLDSVQTFLNPFKPVSSRTPIDTMIFGEPSLSLKRRLPHRWQKPRRACSDDAYHVSVSLCSKAKAFRSTAAIAL